MEKSLSPSSNNVLETSSAIKTATSEEIVIHYPGKEFIKITKVVGDPLEGTDLVANKDSLVNGDKKNTKSKVEFKGCFEFTQTMNQFRKNFGADIGQWPLPKGQTHSEIIIRELILRLKGSFQYPESTEEICHCRHVTAGAIDEAILNGAHDTELISQWTGSSTACGTCKPEVQKLLNLKLQNK